MKHIRVRLNEKTEMGDPSFISGLSFLLGRYWPLFAKAEEYDKNHSFAEPGVLLAIIPWVMKQQSILKNLRMTQRRLRDDTSNLNWMLNRDNTDKANRIGTHIEAIDRSFFYLLKDPHPQVFERLLRDLMGAHEEFGLDMISESDWVSFLRGLASRLLKAMKEHTSA
jgi:hypothetical protein